MRVQLKRILVATDFSENSNLAVSYGQRLSKEFSAKLFLCHVLSVATDMRVSPRSLMYRSQLMNRHLNGSSAGWRASP